MMMIEHKSEKEKEKNKQYMKKSNTSSSFTPFALVSPFTKCRQFSSAVDLLVKA